MLYTNGIIVQNRRALRIEAECEYMGISRYDTWPLDHPDYYYIDDLATKMTRFAYTNWFGFQWQEEGSDTFLYPISSAPELAYACRYVKHCVELDMVPRMLLCKSERSHPMMKENVSLALEALATPLGYDYCTPEGYFSALYDDLWRSHGVPALELLKNGLNKNGLLPGEKLLDKYIETREKALKEGATLETDMDFVAVHISEVSFEDMQDVLRKTTRLTLA